MFILAKVRKKSHINLHDIKMFILAVANDGLKLTQKNSFTSLRKFKCHINTDQLIAVSGVQLSEKPNGKAVLKSKALSIRFLFIHVSKSISNILFISTRKVRFP